MVRTGRVRATALLAAAGAVLAVAPLAQATAANASTASYAFSANAYGTATNISVVGLTASSQRSAYTVLNCTARAQTQTNDAAAVTLAPLSSNIGAITNTATSSISGSVYSDTATSSIAGVSLFGGLITAGAIQAQSNASEGGSSGTESGSVSLANLNINGSSVSANPTPNTVINVAGLGTVTLNAQRIINNGSRAFIQTEAIDVKLAAGNTLGLPVGLVLTVGHTLATVAGPVSGLVSGTAYGTAVTNDPIINAGQSFPAVVDCEGDGGAVTTVRGNGVAVGPLAQVGAIVDTATSLITPTTRTAGTSSTIASANVSVSADVNLLSLTNIRSFSTASVDSSGNLTDSGNVTLASLRILGVPIVLPRNIPANYVVAGLPAALTGATLTLNRQVLGKSGLQTEAVYLNIPGVATVVIGSSSAYA